MEKTCIFDLDGTLVDSLQDLAETTNEVLQNFGFPIHPIEKYQTLVGNGITNLLKRALPEEERDNTALLEKVLNDFNILYKEYYLINTRPYEGIINLIHTLSDRGVKLAVLSNKPTEYVIKIIEYYFKPKTFKVIYGKEPDYPAKPNPELALKIANELGVSAASIYYIGDSDVDMQLALNAKMIPVGVTWGFRSRQELIDNGAKYICDYPEEILNIVL